MEHLFLLRDFDHWFGQLALRVPGTSRLLFEPVREHMHDALTRVGVVELLGLQEARLIANESRQEDEFTLTLDGGTYFSDYDFSFSMTRAVTRISDVRHGRMIRVARQGYGQFWTQVAMLRREYEKGDRRRIIVCDDGIDSGRSLSEVVRQLAAQYLEVAGLRVLLNPHGSRTIEGVEVQSLIPVQTQVWTHERDLFWGSPGGGVSLMTSNNVNQLGGVPYSLNTALLAKRLGLIGTDLDQLRRSLLTANIEFWNLLSRAAGRIIRVRDVKRLAWIPQLNPEFTDQTGIVVALEWFREYEPVL